MKKRLERRPIEPVTASASCRPKVRESEATSHAWRMSPHAAAVWRSLKQSSKLDVAIAKAITGSKKHLQLNNLAVHIAACATHQTRCARSIGKGVRHRQSRNA
uniref:Uncharacterized protein n=1 Tax=Hyaloperonospora arabidopsidis (strain Emoy2) TaxID=559515 RepID=M4B930_HYAAE